MNTCNAVEMDSDTSACVHPTSINRSISLAFARDLAVIVGAVQQFPTLGPIIELICKLAQEDLSQVINLVNSADFVAFERFKTNQLNPTDGTVGGSKAEEVVRSARALKRRRYKDNKAKRAQNGSDSTINETPISEFEKQKLALERDRLEMEQERLRKRFYFEEMRTKAYVSAVEKKSGKGKGMTAEELRVERLSLERARTEAAINERNRRADIAERRLGLEKERTSIYQGNVNNNAFHVRSWTENAVKHTIRSNCSSAEASALSSGSAGLKPSDSVSNTSSEKKGSTSRPVPKGKIAEQKKKGFLNASDKDIVAMSHLQRMQYFSLVNPKQAQTLYERWCTAHGINYEEW